MIPVSMQQYIDTLNECTTPTEKFQFFIELSSQLPPMDSADKTPENKVLGCASNAWIRADLVDNGTVTIIADADAILSKGFLSFFIHGLSGATPEEILSFTVNDLQEMGVIQSLSPSRSNGALSSLNKIHSLVSLL